jgi:hypothetical protein
MIFENILKVQINWIFRNFNGKDVKRQRPGQHPAFSLTKPIKLIKPKLMN